MKNILTFFQSHPTSFSGVGFGNDSSVIWFKIKFCFNFWVDLIRQPLTRGCKSSPKNTKTASKWPLTCVPLGWKSVEKCTPLIIRGCSVNEKKALSSKADRFLVKFSILSNFWQFGEPVTDTHNWFRYRAIRVACEVTSAVKRNCTSRLKL